MILELVNTKYGDYMRIFTCKDKYEDMMTCIYDAWEWALKNGHDNLILRKEPIKQYSLFDEYVHIEGDEEKALKVTDSIRRKISDDAYISVYYATLSREEDALDTRLKRPLLTNCCGYTFYVKEEEIFVDEKDEIYRYYQLCPHCGYIVNIPKEILSDGIRKRIDNRCKKDEYLFREKVLNSELIAINNRRIKKRTI